MHKLKCYMTIVEQAKLHLLNISNLFFKNTYLPVTINLSCLTKEANCIIIQRFAICSVNLGIRYNVLVQIPIIMLRRCSSTIDKIGCSTMYLTLEITIIKIHLLLICGILLRLRKKLSRNDFSQSK